MFNGFYILEKNLCTFVYHKNLNYQSRYPYYNRLLTKVHLFNVTLHTGDGVTGSK